MSRSVLPLAFCSSSALGRCVAETARVAASAGLDGLEITARPPPLDPEAGLSVAREAGHVVRSEGLNVVCYGSYCERPDQIEQTLKAIDRPNVALNWQVLDFLPPDCIAGQADDARRLAPLAHYVHPRNFRFDPAHPAQFQFGGAIADEAFDCRDILLALVGAGYRGPLTIEFLSAEWLPLEQKLDSESRFIREVLRECDL